MSWTGMLKKLFLIRQSLKRSEFNCRWQFHTSSNLFQSKIRLLSMAIRHYENNRQNYIALHNSAQSNKMKTWLYDIQPATAWWMNFKFARLQPHHRTLISLPFWKFKTIKGFLMRLSDVYEPRIQFSTKMNNYFKFLCANKQCVRFRWDVDVFLW